MIVIDYRLLVRSWFLVADSLRPRNPAGPGVTEDLMFIAGECASLLLHGGLDEVPVDRVADFEKKYLAFCRANHADVLASIRDDKKWTDELKSKCDEMVKTFKGEFLA